MRAGCSACPDRRARASHRRCSRKPNYCTPSVYQIIRDLTAQGMANLLVSDRLEDAFGATHGTWLCSTVRAEPNPHLLAVLSHIV